MISVEGCWRSDKPYAGRWELDFGIQEGDKVLDIGSRGRPFPLSTHCLDLQTCNPSEDYKERIITPENKIFIDGSAEDLSMFPDKYFDFIYCNHTIEHIENLPIALEEIGRVGKRGFIACPSCEYEVLFRQRKDGHIWLIQLGLDNVLHIRKREEYEYDDFISSRFMEWYWGSDEIFSYLESHNKRGCRFVWEIRAMWVDKVEYTLDPNLFPNGRLMKL